MSLLFMEGFDSIEVGGDASSSGFGTEELDSTLAQMGFVKTALCLMRNDTRTGRGYSISGVARTSGGGIGNQVMWPIPNRTEVITGFACKHPANVAYNELFQFNYDNFQDGYFSCFRVFKNGHNGITVVESDGETVIAVSEPNVIFPDTWNYIEIKAKAGVLDGEVIVKVNGCAVIYAMNVKTVGEDRPAVFNHLGWYQGYTGSKQLNYYNCYDDWYICDTEGVDFNDFLGDVVIEDLLPSADTGINEMSVVGDVLGHFEAVDDFPLDEDASYLTTNDANLIERFDVVDLGEDVIDVLAVQVSTFARREGTAYKTFVNQLTVGANTSEGAEKFCASSYTEQGDIFTQVPGGSAWTIADVNAMQIGIRTTS